MKLNCHNTFGANFVLLNRSGRVARSVGPAGAVIGQGFAIFFDKQRG